MVDVVLKVYDTMKGKTPGEYQENITISFGEYASPDFDSTVEVVGKAKTYGIMSLEQCIEELYGDTWTDAEKALEVKRIRDEEHVTDEPATNVDGIDDNDEDVIENEE